MLPMLYAKDLCPVLGNGKPLVTIIYDSCCKTQAESVVSLDRTNGTSGRLMGEDHTRADEYVP